MCQLILYTTSHCHLCEQAEAQLFELRSHYALNWLAIEITSEDTLMEKYEVTIPVIKNCDNGKELNWPFTKQNIIQLISQD